MASDPAEVEAMRAELEELRREVAELRSKLEEHIIKCPVEAPAEDPSLAG